MKRRFLLGLIILVHLSACATRWNVVQEMPTPRFAHTATLLPDGTVLVTGGLDDGGAVLDSAVRYDPQKNSWSSAGTMSTPRARHTATLLDNGLVLVAGGATKAIPPAPLTTSAQLYNPMNNTWTEVAPTSIGRADHKAVKLLDGTVLLIGGGSTGSIDLQRSVERFDSTNNKWLPVESMIEPHELGTATLLDDGTVLVGGGLKFGPEQNNPTETLVPFSERFTPLSGHWGEWALLNDSPVMPAAVALSDGTVLITGGRSTGLSSGSFPGKNVVRYDRTRLVPNASPQPNVWQIMATMSEGRANHEATLLGNNDVLVTGGFSSGTTSLRSAEQYNVKADMWTMVDGMFYLRGDHTATLLKDGRVLVVGGFNKNSGHATASAEIYSPP